MNLLSYRTGLIKNHVKQANSPIFGDEIAKKIVLVKLNKICYYVFSKRNLHTIKKEHLISLC